MKKQALLKRSIGILMLAMTVQLLATPFAYAQTTIGTSSSPDATSYPFQRKGFYAHGLFWQFYYDHAIGKIVWRTSVDGTSWSAATNARGVTGGQTGTCFSIWFDGTYVYYAYAPGATPIYFRRGTPTIAGGIIWNNEQTITVPGNNPQEKYPFVSTDSNGYPWIGYLGALDYTTSRWYPYVIKSSTNNGTWVTAAGFPHQLSSADNTGWTAGAIPLTNGKMLAIYALPSTTIKAKLWDGAAWGAEKATTSQAESGVMWSAAASGDDVEILFLKDVDYHILDCTYTYSTNSIGDETVIQPSVTSTSAPVLARDTVSGDSYSFWQGSPTANHVYYKKRIGGAWDANPTDWLNESTDSLTKNSEITSSYTTGNGSICVNYSTKTASPYNVIFAYLNTTLQNNPPTIDQFQAPATAYAGKYFLLNATINDADGVADLYNATIMLSSNVTLRWEAGDTWAEDDPNGYLTLDAGGCTRTSVNNTAYRISFRVKLGWSYPRGSFDVITSGTKVYDTLGGSGSSGLASASTFENDIEISGALANDSRVNPSQQFSISGTVHYRGTSSIPEDTTGITAKVSLGDILQTSTNTFNSGTFNISLNAPASISSYSYTVWAEANRPSTTNSTIEVKVDAIKLATSQVYIESETVKVLALYAFDDTPIGGATLSYSGKTATTNATGWATFDTSLINTIQANSTATGVSEPTYGLTTCAETQTISLHKLRVPPFAVTSSHAVTNQDWNDVTRKLSFQTSGTSSVDVGDYGQPLTLTVDNEPWSNWTYTPDKRVIISGIAGLVVLTWESSPPSGGTVEPPVNPPANNTDTNPPPIIPITPTIPTSNLVNIGIAAIVVTVAGFYINQEMKNKNPITAWKTRSKNPRKSVDWRKRK